MKNTKADGNNWNISKIRGYVKRLKNRAERRKAKRNVESQPTYGRYKGWVT